MEELKDFYSELKSRLNSPLIGSYIIAWVVFNWQIPIILLFYKQSELKLDGYHSFQDVISKNTNFLNNLIFPLIIAFTYTFFFPYLRAWIKEHQIKVVTKSQDKIYEVTYKSKTYSTKLDELKKEVGSKEAELDLTKELMNSKINEITKQSFEIDRQNSEIENLNKEIADVNRNFSNLRNLNSVTSLKGNWQVEFKDDYQKVNEIWVIKSFEVIVNTRVKYQISNLISYNNQLWLHFKKIDGRISYLFILDITNGLDNLKGEDINKDEISFKSLSV